MHAIKLKKGADKRIRAGHLWIFSNEIAKIDGPEHAEPGMAATIMDHHGTVLGIGYYNKNSLIAARLLSRHSHEPDLGELVKRRILAAIEYRTRHVPSGDQGYRLVYSEGDAIPGLIVDAYGDWLVAQFLTAGIDRLRNVIIDCLQEVMQPKGIILRNDSHFRAIEGLEQGVELVGEAPPVPLELTIEDLTFSVDLKRGQKTGHFFDQSENRRKFRTMVEGYKVLDCFCYSGGWGLQAAKGGAKSVIAVDSSQLALDMVTCNAKLNGCSDLIEVKKSSVQPFLKEERKAGRLYDAIVLDPPAYAKSKKDRKEAMLAYLRLNGTAMACLAPGGMLVTSSCSYHVALDEFIAIMGKAAAGIGRFARVVHVGRQGPDHPVPCGLPEASYLKCLFLQID